MAVSVPFHVPPALPPRKEPGTHWTGGGHVKEWLNLGGGAGGVERRVFQKKLPAPHLLVTMQMCVWSLNLKNISLLNFFSLTEEKNAFSHVVPGISVCGGAGRQGVEREET
jgi:hypothetical protein